MKLLRLLSSGTSRFAALAARIKAPQWVSIALIAVTLLCAAVFLWLLFETALDKDTQLWGKAFVFLIGLLTAAATVAVSWEPDETPPLKRLATPWGAGVVLVAVFTAFGTMTDALSLFEPRAATTDDTGAIKGDTEEILDEMNELTRILRDRFPDSPPILTEIVGRWGEQDTCALVWDIAIIQKGTDAALVAEIVKRPDGVEPFRLLADITGAKGQTLNITGEDPVSARGAAAELTLNPATQRLVWDDKSSAGGVEEYVRCPEG
jgi:hypothetical protein